MDDGKIVFSTKLDNSDLEKDLSKLTKKIQSQEDQLTTKQKMRSPLVEQSKQLSLELDRAKMKLHEMQGAASNVFSKDQIAEQKENVASIQSKWNRVQSQVESYDRSIEKATIELNRSKERAGELAEQLAQCDPNARKMSDALGKADKQLGKFTQRVKGLMKRVLVFTLITMALRGMRDWMGKVIRTNEEATAAIGRLKGALLTLAQPLVNIIIPAFTTLVNVLTAVVGQAAKLISALFGTTVEQSAQAAESLQEEVDALEDTGAAAKKAGKSLASFDEINKLSDSSGGGGASSSAATEPIEPDFSWATGISDLLADIAEAVFLIATGFALWKIGSALPGALGLILTKLGALMVAIGGVVLFFHGLKDAWENGVDWGNLAAMIAGVAVAALGLNAAFGPMAAGIALVVGGVAMLVTGFKDMMENGVNVQNVLLTIAGIIATGLGITLLTGSWIPLLIAGIAAVLLGITALCGNGQQLIDNLKQTFKGLLDFIVGVFTNDAERAGEGLQNLVHGLANTVLTIIGSLVNFVIMGLNWMIEKINSIEFDVPDWVPLIGGKSLSPSIPSIKEWDIPQLAQGAVIPPNREFLAVLGDQKSGTNIETPLSTMVDAFKQAINETGMGGGRSGGDIVLQIDGKAFARITNPYYKNENSRIGMKMVSGVK